MKLDLPPLALERYLTENIHFGLEEEYLAGLNLYFEKAAAAGLIRAKSSAGILAPATSGSASPLLRLLRHHRPPPAVSLTAWNASARSTRCAATL